MHGSVVILISGKSRVDPYLERNLSPLMRRSLRPRQQAEKMPTTPVLAVLDHWLSAVLRQIQAELFLAAGNGDNWSFYRFRVKTGCQKADCRGFVGPRYIERSSTISSLGL